MELSHIVYISVGSNLGDKLLNCQTGIHALSKPSRSVLKGKSSYYLTGPVDYPDQDWFVNAVVKIETSLEPPAVLKELKLIERQAGRTQQAVRFGPRTLDLDILFYDDAMMDTPELVVPHPRLHKRCFVLKPMCDIDPWMIHPVLKKNMRRLLCELEKMEPQQVRFLCD
ncbi:MAG: 2-amino-4-hydroxy-6-hydroxymethyldihydropteridine diphosphokinase [Desulfobacterales bacterium]|nr:2-amino-4-hydroxy-6-hydroxymethyldihydropteridine diphosphokinase [Desulfobacterales bacterium]